MFATFFRQTVHGADTQVRPYEIHWSRNALQELWRRDGVQRSEAAQPSDPIPKLREAAARRLILRKTNTAADAAAEKCPRERVAGESFDPYDMHFGGSECRYAEGEVCR